MRASFQGRDRQWGPGQASPPHVSHKWSFHKEYYKRPRSTKGMGLAEKNLVGVATETHGWADVQYSQSRCLPGCHELAPVGPADSHLLGVRRQHIDMRSAHSSTSSSWGGFPRARRAHGAPPGRLDVRAGHELRPGRPLRVHERRAAFPVMCSALVIWNSLNNA